MKKFENISYSSAPNQTIPGNSNCLCDLFLPDNLMPDTPLFIEYHGGGIESGSKEGDHSKICEILASRGIAAVSANYRMYPTAKYPEFIEDAAACIAYWKANISKYTGGVGKFYIGGESAGAYLSMMLCFDRSYLLKHGIDPDTDISGWVHGGGQPTAHFNVLRERGIDSKRVIVDESAPMFHLDRNTFAPMILLTSTNDIQARMPQLMSLEASLHHFGFNDVELHVIEGGHCSYFHPDADGTIIFAEFVTKMICG